STARRPSPTTTLATPGHRFRIHRSRCFLGDGTSSRGLRSAGCGWCGSRRWKPKKKAELPPDSPCLCHREVCIYSKGAPPRSVPGIVFGDPRGVLQLPPAAMKNSSAWQLADSDVIAHFIQVKSQIRNSRWYASEIKFTTQGGELLEGEYPDLEA